MIRCHTLRITILNISYTIKLLETIWFSWVWIFVRYDINCNSQSEVTPFWLFYPTSLDRFFPGAILVPVLGPVPSNHLRWFLWLAKQFHHTYVQINTLLNTQRAFDRFPELSLNVATFFWYSTLWILVTLVFLESQHHLSIHGILWFCLTSPSLSWLGNLLT